MTGVFLSEMIESNSNAAAPIDMSFSIDKGFIAWFATWLRFDKLSFMAELLLFHFFIILCLALLLFVALPKSRSFQLFNAKASVGSISLVSG